MYPQKVITIQITFNFDMSKTTHPRINLAIKINLKQTNAAEWNHKLSFNSVRIILQNMLWLLTATLYQSSDMKLFFLTNKYLRNCAHKALWSKLYL